MDALIRNCAFRYECPRSWEDLQETEEGRVRFCNACESPVYLCETDAELRRHMVSDHCVAIPLRLRGRKPNLGGLEARSITMGVPRWDPPEQDS